MVHIFYICVLLIFLCLCKTGNVYSQKTKAGCIYIDFSLYSSVVFYFTHIQRLAILSQYLPHLAVICLADIIQNLFNNIFQFAAGKNISGS